MNKTSVVRQVKTESLLPPAQGLLQRKCTCGNLTVAGGECAECAKKKSGLQRKLSIGASNDPLEQEADRIAGQVMAAPSPTASSGAPLRIQRFSGQSSGQMDEAPASVDRVLAGSGRPLEPMLRQDMEQRFGYDFSHVRVHSGNAAEQSARDVNANAYTVGHNIVFGTGRFVPGTYEGRQLLAHELTHVVQQSGSDGIRLDQGSEKRGLSPTCTAGRSFPAGVVRKGAGAAAVGAQRKPDPKVPQQPEERSVVDPKGDCEDEVDCTQEFQAFITGFSARVQAMTDLNDEQRRGFKQMADFVFGKEGKVDPKTWKIVACSKINLEVGRPGESFSAFFDHNNKKMGLTKQKAKLLSASVLTKEKLAELLESIAHEKRHATLGGALSVGVSGLKPGRSSSLAPNAGYRAEEILTIAEEIAVGRMALGSEYVVERPLQEQLYRIRNLLRGWVTEDEYQRLRQLIIDKLRQRYGFEDGCDNGLTVGVVRSMERNEWYSCDRENRTIYGKVPEGLKICTDDKHSFCKKTPGG